MAGWAAVRGIGKREALNRGLGVASVVFKYAIEFEAIENNPCEGVRRYSEVGRGRECYLTAEESKALIASCSDWFRPFVVIALHTGMRRGEILELQWDQVEFLHTPGRIQARRKDSRTKKKRLVGMNKHARAALMQVREAAGEANATRVDRVFPWTSWKVRKEWDATLSRCQGIPDDKKEDVVFHTLRHYADSRIMPIHMLRTSPIAPHCVDPVLPRVSLSA